MAPTDPQQPTPPDAGPTNDSPPIVGLMILGGVIGNPSPNGGQ